MGECKCVNLIHSLFVKDLILGSISSPKPSEVPCTQIPRLAKFFHVSNPLTQTIFDSCISWLFGKALCLELHIHLFRKRDMSLLLLSISFLLKKLFSLSFVGHISLIDAALETNLSFLYIVLSSKEEPLSVSPLLDFILPKKVFWKETPIFWCHPPPYFRISSISMLKF